MARQRSVLGTRIKRTSGLELSLEPAEKSKDLARSTDGRGLIAQLVGVQNLYTDYYSLGFIQPQATEELERHKSH